MGCEDCLELLSEFVDGTLGTENRELFAAHLGGCLVCACVRRDLELIVRLARELRDDFSFAPSPALKLSIFSKPLYSAATH